ncbi:MAG: DUF493 domain-containing protein [Thioploca sp.]|nr:DUF493 domain-containing protein [Thioploca sp.]
MLTQDTLFEFPCTFPIKVVGKTTEHFDLLVIEIIRHHCQDLTENTLTTRTSRGGKYSAVTVTIMAQSRAQLDALYQELSAHKQIMMVF